MPSAQAKPLHASSLQQELLHKMAHRSTSAQRLVKRTHIALEALKGTSNTSFAQHLKIDDETTGMQALERLHPSLPIQPGHVERQEFEYKRHGTQSLMANLDVASGQVVTPSIGPTRDLCRLCRSHHADPPDRSRGHLDLHH